MKLSDIIVILSRPSEGGNVGAVCRAMKNMGLSRLRIAAPEYDRGNEGVIKARAIHAAELWEEAQNYDNLAEAVKDCSLVIGTTRRRGRNRKRVSMSPRELGAFLKDHPGPAALFFCNERTGLEEDEIELCHIASHIPADDTFPSLNLSHAVQIYSYELFLSLGLKPAVKGQWVPMDAGAAEELARSVTEDLKLLGFYKKVDHQEQERFFLDIFSRAALTGREGKYFANIISKAAHLAGKA